MQKTYNFWLLPYDEFIQDNENAYSAIDGTLNYAYKWAEFLVKINKADGAIFKAENGRKEYRIFSEES